MKISVIVKTNSKKLGVEKIDESNFVVRVKELPIKGRANEAVKNILAEYFSVASWRIEIIGGATSNKKYIIIN
ncbi:DUF167 domain-containing protein [Patescibacteria group bacterium]|nr:DUF167 domain-containing protein [Patescibacteria group bacterium]